MDTVKLLCYDNLDLMAYASRPKFSITWQEFVELMVSPEDLPHLEHVSKICSPLSYLRHVVQFTIVPHLDGMDGIPYDTISIRKETQLFLGFKYQPSTPKNFIWPDNLGTGINHKHEKFKEFNQYVVDTIAFTREITLAAALIHTLCKSYDNLSCVKFQLPQITKVIGWRARPGSVEERLARHLETSKGTPAQLFGVGSAVRQACAEVGASIAKWMLMSETGHYTTEIVDTDQNDAISVADYKNLAYNFNFVTGGPIRAYYWNR